MKKISFEFHDDKVINLNKRYLSEEELSLLFFSCDAVFLPYKVCSGSGVMFDGLGHGKPFVASDLDFFREFSSMSLGMVTERDPRKFEKAFEQIDKHYKHYEFSVEEVLKQGMTTLSVEEFKKDLIWDNIARHHISIYKGIIENKSLELPTGEMIHTPKRVSR